ncbi:helix-turn-helix domain-containing protein [Paenibacillus macerans]|uniref:helix-turn-helix transcriptional regulator n=1 Tax=Paenibacillus macerans TaxID=44252 RepID=UPI003D30F87B
MEPENRIFAAIEELERNLFEELNIAKIAKLGYVSSTQLYRDFYSATGHSVKEYVRKRRLSQALALLKHSDRSLAEIAYACGYSSQQAFCKTLKAAIGQTPTDYKNGDNYYYFPPYDSWTSRQVAVAAEVIPETLSADYVQDVPDHLENNALAALFALVPDYHGRMFGRNGEAAGNRHVYRLFLQGVGKAELSQGPFSAIQTVPSIGATFATTATANDPQAILEAWNNIYTGWLASSMFQQTELPYFEEYLHKEKNVRKVKLYLPVEKRSGLTKIAVERLENCAFLVASQSGQRAEESAAEMLIGYLQKHNPRRLCGAGTFFVSKQVNRCTCGIGIPDGLTVAGHPNVSILRLESDDYAALYGDGSGDYALYDRILARWIRENGLEADETPAFAVYQADGAFEPKEVKLYRRLKPGKNG